MLLKVNTCNETGHFPGIGVVGDSLAGGAHVDLQRVEGQQVAPVVLELGVDAQHAIVVLQVAQVESELLLGAIHLAEVQEGRQGVDLLSLAGLAAKVVGGVSRPADGGGPEGGDAAFVAAGGEPTVVGRNLDDAKVNLVSFYISLKKHIFLKRKVVIKLQKKTFLGFDPCV